MNPCKTFLWLVIGVSILCSSCNVYRPTPSSPELQKKENVYYDLGGFHHPVSTDSALAQTWFDRGLAMCLAFNHEEAVRCFEFALKEDPSMAMALWGLAYAWGPNINNPQIEPHQIAQASTCIRLAGLYSKPSTPVEQALIEALGHRYLVPVPEDRQPLNKAYAGAMRKLYKAFGQDPLVATLFAESLMMLRPWKHWSPDGQPAEETPEILAVLEKALESTPDYPGLCHLYIHAMEASPTPERALPAANALRDAMPGAGHLVHMPSHIDVLVGDYHASIVANQKAIIADEAYVRREGRDNFYTLYRIHNYHFVVYSAMFDGQSELALRTAREIPKQIPLAMQKSFVDFVDAFIPTPLHVLIRFGRWEEILQEPEPAAFLPMSRSIWRYARAIAYAAMGKIAKAEEEKKAFQEMRASVPETSILFNNSCNDILGIASRMLAGEISYRKGEIELAFKQLREAVELDDALNYDEPWGWMQPARHALGALLLEQGRPEEAEAVYRIDLRRHPKNVWALHGLAESLSSQGNDAEASKIRAQFEKAVVRTDIIVDRSCFCRNNN